jgi:hypothetical protein
MTMLRLISLAAGLLLSLGAAAQSPAKSSAGNAGSAAAAAQLRPASVPLAATDDSRREARALGDLLLFPDRARNTVAQLRAQAVQATAQRSGKSLDEAARIVDEIIMPDFRDVEARIAALLVENLAAGFTASDLAQMRTFFASPVGQRWIQSMPAVERDDRRQIQLLGQQVFRDAITRHADALQAHGVNF